MTENDIIKLLDALANHNWWVLVSLALTVLVAALRRWTWSWFSTRVGGWILNLALAMGTTFAALFALGQPTWDQLFTALIESLKIAAGSALAYQAVKDAAPSVAKATKKVVVPAVAVILCLFTLTQLTACATCKEELHRNDFKCVLINDIVDCTVDQAVAVAPQFLPLVAYVISLVTGTDGTIDWAALEQALVAFGIRDGGCILAALENQYANNANKPQASPRLMQQYRSYTAGFNAYRQKRWPGVKFKLADGTVI